jgi:hypothetical protein
MSVIFRFPGSLCLGGFLAFSGALWGQTVVVPQGSEFSILGGIPGDQVWPTISLSPTGGVVAWQDSIIDKTGGGLGTAVLDASFQAGHTVRINNTASGNHFRPQAQVLADDNVLFVWDSTVAGNGQDNIYARFAKNSAPKKSATYGTNFYGTNFYTGDIQVNTYVAGPHGYPAVAALPDGSAILTWHSWGQDGSMYGVYARRLKSTGAGATAKEFQVNQYTSYNQRNPAVAALPNGNYVIAWVSEQERTPNSADVYARVYTDAGVPLTDEIPINSGAFPCTSPAIAPLLDGGFTVVWAQKDTVDTTNSWDIWGRPFSATGMPATADFRINTYLYGDQIQPKIAASPAGSLVVWTSLNQDGSREGVFGRFLAGGTQVSGGEGRVNTTTMSQQMHPSVAWDGVGHFLVVWASFTGQQGFDLFGQLYVLGSSN